MKIGDLVKHCSEDLGIVTGHFTHEEDGEEYIEVTWLTGRYVGEIDAIWKEMGLEVIV